MITQTQDRRATSDVPWAERARQAAGTEHPFPRRIFRLASRFDPSTGEAIEALSAGRALALRVPDFCSPQECAALTTAITADAGLKAYEDEQNLSYGRGTPFYDVRHSLEGIEAYFDVAQRQMQDNAVFAGVEWPFERGRRWLDLHARYGARLLRAKDGRAAFAGLARVIHGEGELEPHNDDIVEDDRFDTFGVKPVAMLSAVVYLSMPEGGRGGLSLWDLKPSIDERAIIRDPDHAYRFSADEIGPAVRTIVPQPGELVLFDSGRIHQVHSPRGLRVTVSFFYSVLANGTGVLHS